jgi:hypothetical protein
MDMAHGFEFNAREGDISQKTKGTDDLAWEKWIDRYLHVPCAVGTCLANFWRMRCAHPHCFALYTRNSIISNAHQHICTRTNVFHRVQIIIDHLFLSLIDMGLYCYRLCEVHDDHLRVCSFLCRCCRLSIFRKSGLTTSRAPLSWWLYSFPVMICFPLHPFH